MTETILTVEQANQIREQNTRLVNLGNSLERLMNNADFKTVFLTEYLEKEPSRIVRLLGDTVVNSSPDKVQFREDLQERMIGIARFDEYLRQVFNLASQAQNQLDALNKAEIIND